MLLLGDAAGNEDAEMADGFMHGVDDGLPVSPDLVDIGIEIEDPVQGLLRRGDVVALGAEYHDRRADVAEIDGGAVRHLDAAGGQIVADEELIDDELDFFRVQIDVAAPPTLEVEIAVRLRVDLGIDVVLLGPQRIGGIFRLRSLLHQPGAVELSGAKVAGQRGEPASAEEAARIAHWIFAVDARPIGERRAGDDQRAEQFRPQRSQDHHCPAGLAVADYARLAVGFRMAADDLFNEPGLGTRDAFDRLSWHRFRQEADEVAGMARLHGDPDLAVGLEAPDARVRDRHGDRQR